MVHGLSTELYHQIDGRHYLDWDGLLSWVSESIDSNTDSFKSSGSDCSSDDFDRFIPCCYVLTICETSDDAQRGSEREPRYHDRIPPRKVFTLAPYNDVPVIGQLGFDFDKTFSRETILQKPQRIGYFSLKINRRNGQEIYCPNKSQLRYFCRKIRFNPLELSRGFDPQTIWSRCPYDLRHILRWYVDNKYDFTLDENLADFTELDFITDIRTLTAIMDSPNDTKNDWDIIGIKMGEKIILHEIDSVNRRNAVAGQSVEQNNSSYAGYKFETLITRRYDMKSCPAYYGGLRDSFHSVLVTKVGQHKILYNARSACVKNKSELNKNINEMEFVEVKTKYRNRTWHSRLSGIWARSLLNNISFTAVGQRDESFKVDMNDLKPYKTVNIPSPRNNWSPSTMANCLKSTLDFVKSQVIEDHGVYRFNHSPGNPIVCQKLDEPYTKYIPDRYIEG